MKDELAFGRKAQGKSTKAIYRAIKMKPEQILIYDACCQYPSFPSASSPGQLRAMLKEKEAGGERFNIIAYQPPDGESMENFPEFAKICWDCEYRPLVVIVDEASELQTPTGMEPSLSRLVRQGHRYGIATIQTTHRPPDVHRRSWALASTYIFFRTTDNRDLERIEKQCGEEVAGEVRKLGKHECLVWDEDAQTFEVIKDPSTWYIDIHGEGSDKPKPKRPPQVSASELELEMNSHAA